MAGTRITAGQWRGRALTVPSRLRTRPTRSVVREALFNILGSRIIGATLLDLYAGAGTVGFEALSRGASRVVFVERDRVALDHIAATAGRLSCAARCELVAADVAVWLRSRPAQLQAAQVCFLDAPYQDDAVLEALEAIAASPPPLVVCEHHRARPMPAAIGRLGCVRRSRYGLTDLTFMERIGS